MKRLFNFIKKVFAFFFGKKKNEKDEVLEQVLNQAKDAIIDGVKSNLTSIPRDQDETPKTSNPSSIGKTDVDTIHQATKPKTARKTQKKTASGKPQNRSGTPKTKPPQKKV